MNARFRRLTFAISVLAGVALIPLWLCRIAARDPGIQFLAHREPANWIVYPAPFIPIGRDFVELNTKFRREFVISNAPSSATLSLCAFKRSTARINGTVLSLPSAPAGNWKECVSVNVGKLLHQGQNRIEVDVSNESGPPALWLSLSGSGLSMISDTLWQASYAGAVWRPARLAEAPLEIAASSYLSGGERVVTCFRRQWFLFPLFACITGGVLLGWNWQLQRRRIDQPLQSLEPKSTPHPSALVDRGGDGDGLNPAVVCLGVAVLVWVVLLAHNAAMLSRAIGFDGKFHLDYIQYIQERGSLPLASEGPSMYNPPLYYLLSAGLLSALGLTTQDFAGIVALRYLALAIGVAHIILVFLCLRLIFPRQKGRQAIGVLLAGFLPAHLYLAHYVTNEGLLSFLVTATIYATLRALQAQPGQPRRFAWIGALLGLSLLTKFTAILLVPFVFGAIGLSLYQSQGGLRQVMTWLRTAGLVAAVTLLICGWHYARVWIHFGRPLVGAWDAVSGLRWWQDAGYTTGAFFGRVGASLSDPLFSGRNSLADGIYSTLWGDAYCGGAASLDYRPPWNYELMAASYLLALAPTLLVLVGAVCWAGKFFRKPTCEALLLNGLAASFAAAFFYMALKVPWYSQIKAFYGLLALLPFSAFGAEGWAWLTQRRIPRLILSLIVGVWALTSLSTYWISGNSAQPQFLIGHELAIAGRHAQAVDHFRAALEVDPSHLNSKWRLANSLQVLGQPAEAERLLSELREQYPASAVCQMDLASRAETEGSLDAAVSFVRRAIQARPDEEHLRRELASMLLKSRKREQTIEAARDGLGIAPGDWQLHMLLGTALLSKTSPAGNPTGSEHAVATSGEAQEGFEHLRLACQLSQDSSTTLNRLAWYLATYPDERWRNGQEAVRLAEQACQLTGYRLPEVLGTLAVASAEAGRFPEAIGATRSAQRVAKELGQTQLTELHEEWLRLFAAGQPYREGPTAPRGPAQ